jgi:L-lactate dehydrogenase complex protein LldG
MSDENQFLKTVRNAIATGTDRHSPPQSQAGPAQTGESDLLRSIDKRTARDHLDLILRFQENAAPLNINTVIVASHDEATAVIVDLIRSKDPEFSHNRHVMVHDHPDLASLGLWRKFNRESVTVHTSFAPDPEIREKTVASFIGITAPDICIAESATLVELGGPGRPRSVSLVPSIHIAVLHRRKIVADLREAYALLKKRPRLDSAVFISGPSKTADIEAHMVYGAHGPREQHVIIISPPVADGEKYHPVAQ